MEIARDVTGSKSHGRGLPVGCYTFAWGRSMPIPAAKSRVVHFGVFEVDLQEEELRKSGIRIKLQEQPFQILIMLLERPGQTVTREELQRHFWPANTISDVDHSLNASIKKLREALGDDSDSPRFIETLHRRGYRFIAPLDGSRAFAADLSKPILPSAAIRATPKKLTRWQKRVALFARVAAIGLAVAGAWYLRFGRAAPIDSIAVLPFTNGGGDASTEYLSDGITESLIGSLAHVPQLKVKSRSSVFRYKGKDTDVQKVGNELGVSALVSGRLAPRGDRIEVSAELTDVRDSTEIWGQHYSAKNTEIISVEKQIAGDIAEKLRSRLSSSEKQQVARQGTQNPEAYDLYLKGRYSWRKRNLPDLEAAISYFNQAIAKDPGYALAYSGLADVFTVLPARSGFPSGEYPKANAAARKALALDASLARPHAVLGNSEMLNDWDFAGGEAEFKKALELDPNDATAHQWYGEVLSMIGGREQEAIAELTRARELDPLSPAIGMVAGQVHVLARQFDEAIAICRKVADENPSFAGAHICLSQGYWGKRMYPQVIDEWKAWGQLEADRNDSEFASALEQGFRLSGWRGALMKGIQVRQEQRKHGYYSACEIGRFYADLGDRENAFRWLDIAYREHDYQLVVRLKNDFRFDSIRADPRFAELVRKVGLPQ